MKSAEPIGSDAPCGEHEPELAGRGVQVVLHDVRQEHLGGTKKGEVGERSGEQRAPQPDSTTHEAQALLHGLERRFDVVRVEVNGWVHGKDSDGGSGKGSCVDGERGTGAEAGYKSTAQSRPEQGATRSDE